MFYDVTLLTGADVKTFQGRAEKSLHQEKKSNPIKCVHARVCVCVEGVQTEISAAYLQHMNEDVGVL